MANEAESQTTQQAQITATGIVVDAWGEPLPGAAVIERGVASNGTATDVNGRFTLRVNQGATLTISYIGFVTQEIPAGTDLAITLHEETSALDEVVVVGFGTQRRANLTGAVSQISSQEIGSRSVPSLTQALQGRVAGLNITTSNGAPGTNQSINLRGYTGIRLDSNGNMERLTAGPLVVIDGVQGGDLSTIEMNDVESITFLKDAASAAIYGSSAPYGVIIVTTKRGRVGKPVITYNNNIGFSQPINLPSYVNSLQFAEAFNEVAANSRYGGPLFNDDVIQRIKDYQAGKITDQTIKHPTNDEWLSFNGANANNDWFDIYFKNYSFSQQHNIGVSGASETSNYFVGVGFTQQDGLYNWANDGFRRYNARANLTSHLTDWLTFSFRSSFSRGQTDVPAIYSGISGGNSFSYDYFHQIGRTYPTVPLRNPDGFFSEGSGVLNFTDGGRRKETIDNLSLTGEFIARPLPGWDITANYTYAGTYIENSNHRKTFYVVRPSGDRFARSGTTPNFLERNMHRNQQFTINAFTSYEKTFVDNHYFRGLVGFTQELHDRLRVQASNDNLYSDEIPSLAMTFGTNRNGSDALSQLAIRGAFARINYNYQEKYLVEFNGRYDGSSRFMAEERFKFYPGVSSAWTISRESFWEPMLDYVNQFKIRGSWASLGDQSFINDFYPFYPSLGSWAPTSTNWLFGSNRESAIFMPGLINRNLTWATINTLGWGIDVAALGNRLDFSFDWYRRDAKDFAGPGASLPALLGTGAPTVNNAEIRTNGFEITLGWRDRIGQFSYGARFVLSDYVGTVTKYEGNKDRLINTFYPGMKLGEIWGFETVGLFQNQAEIDAADQSLLNANWFPGDVHYRTFSEDGKLTRGRNTVDDPGDRRIIGNTTPRYQFGLTLNAEYKGFDISTFLQGVGKRDMMFAGNANFFWGFAGNEWQSSYFTVHTDRWTEDNPGGYLPRAYFNTDKNRQASTRYLQDASYLRIKNMQVGYVLPRQVTDKVKLQRVRFFVNVENIATFTNLMKIIDPEIVNTEAKVYPLRRTWAFGTNITF
ncbi:MAG: TonB-dependent receptor [Dysgonamonadaceae bacterium]|nr:TonB-dependent receptor [Dysgonamonadaceae bacterium]